LSWMIDIWMKKHLVCDSNCNCESIIPQKICKDIQIMLEYTSWLAKNVQKWTFQHVQKYINLNAPIFGKTCVNM
jgi:hypothetical protein